MEKTPDRTGAPVPPPITRRHTRALLTAALVASTVAAYVPAMQGGFIWDDDRYVETNQALRSAAGLQRIWLQSGPVPPAFPVSSQYYPLVYTSFWIEYHTWGLHPAPYHAANIGLHALGALLLWRVLSLLRVSGAWFAAALFALHPVHVESVAWISERKNVLSGVFYFGALLAYFRYASPVSSPGSRLPRPPAGSRWLYATALGLFVCALLSKSVTCSLPAAILVITWWKHGRVVDVRRMIPFLVVGLPLGLLTIWMEKFRSGAVGASFDLSLLERCLIAGRALWFYAGKVFWPAGLTFIYPRWNVDAGVWWQYLFPLGAALVVVGLWLGRRRLGRGPLAAVLLFAGTLFPALGFFDIFPMQFSFVADHFQYLASVALIVLGVGAAHAMARRFAVAGSWPRIAAAVMMGTILAGAATLTWHQCRIYESRETLWRATVERNPGAGMAHNNLALELQARGAIDEAIHHFGRAVDLEPWDVTARANLALALRSRGRLDEAIHHLERATALQPDAPDLHYYLGGALQAAGRLPGAADSYRRAIALSPGFSRGHNELAVVLHAQGQFADAAMHYQRALELEPERAEIHYNLGTLMSAEGRSGEAVRYYRQAIALDPELAEAHYNLSNALRAQGKTDEALRHYRRALALRPDLGRRR
jgi:tetratricopeptide (TPR) repeat protein